MAKSPMRVYTMDEIKDEFLGKIGTPERDKYEYRLLKAEINFNIKMGDRYLQLH